MTNYQQQHYYRTRNGRLITAVFYVSNEKQEDIIHSPEIPFIEQRIKKPHDIKKTNETSNLKQNSN